jgi:hypothetical protein
VEKNQTQKNMLKQCSKRQGYEDLVKRNQQRMKNYSHFLKRKLLKGQTKQPEVNYEDNLFMLSLVPELRTFPKAMELDIKSDWFDAVERQNLRQSDIISSVCVVRHICWLSVRLPQPPELYGFCIEHSIPPHQNHNSIKCPDSDFR